MTRKELIDSIASAAEPVYGAHEAAAIARLVAEMRYGLARVDCALDPRAAADPGPDFQELLTRIAAARPVQYILGTACFDGLELSVGEGVLIPRPETEELVHLILDDAGVLRYEPTRKAQELRNCATRIIQNPQNLEKPSLSILDIGTGSGAIAIALAKRLPGAHVTAIDNSSEALEFARRNNEKTNAGITLLRADILDPAFDPGPAAYDIIVSNPPYIPASERSRMRDNVTRYEPAVALFVPDDDSLVFYRAIAKFARRRLSETGALYFEIHERAAESVAGLLKAEGFRDITVKEDINSKPRMVRCRP